MSEIIRSRSHPLVKQFRAVRDRRGSGPRQRIFLEGPRLVEEARSAGLRGIEILATEAATREHAASLAALGASGARVRVADTALVESLSPVTNGQGIVAVADRPQIDPETVFGGTPFVLMAVGIQDPGNLGGLLRTAEAAGASGVLLTGGCADPFGWKALRGSMGSALRLPHVTVDPVDAALELASAHGLRLVATSADAEHGYAEADYSGALGVLVGSEGAGLPAAALEAAHQRVRIPLAGPVESLNVGVAAGIVLFEAARQRSR